MKHYQFHFFFRIHYKYRFNKINYYSIMYILKVILNLKNAYQVILVAEQKVIVCALGIKKNKNSVTNRLQSILS